MAKAMTSNTESDLIYLTDCKFFINGPCQFNDTCRYRHSREAADQTNTCLNWPQTCRKLFCPYRHPAKAPRTSPKRNSQLAEVLLSHPVQLRPQASATKRQEGLISFFWDIENVPIPKGQKPFDIVQRIRQKLVIEPNLQEAAFSCYCNSNMISEANQLSLHHANIGIVHVPDRKPGAVDRKIMLELDRFERVHRPPATIVLISGDIDFVGKLNGLRHQAGFYVIVIHNKPAKEELKATVNEHYPWELFTQQLSPPLPPPQQPMHETNGWGVLGTERTARESQPNRTRRSSRNRSQRRRDPSPNRPFPPNTQQWTTNNREGQQQQQRIVHLCPKCPNGFETVQALVQHQNAKSHLFNCSLCNENFLTQIDQSQHQRDKHRPVQEYRCNHCNRCFGKIESLDQHRQATGHLLPSIQPRKHNEFIHPHIPSSSLPINNHNHNDDDQDMLIILQGIEVIKQHFGKLHLKKN
jgi:hypothetical protein